MGNKLSEDVSATGFLGFVLLFVPIWWVWMGTTFYANRFAADDLTHHLLIFAQIFVVSALAIHVFDGLGETSAGFRAGLRGGARDPRADVPAGGALRRSGATAGAALRDSALPSPR